MTDTMDGHREAEAGGGVRGVTLVIPTRNEAPNIEPLLASIAALPPGVIGEVIVVDDSDDETPAAVLEHASLLDVPVRCLHRRAGERAGGLSTAVTLGMRSAASEWVAVMDADLQHPPELLTQMLREARQGELDLVAATRYRRDGTAAGLGRLARKVVSRSSNLAARALFRSRLRGVSDPMSGYFLVRRDAIDIDALRPIGFKILLEILVRNDLRVGEVPFAFGVRHAGTSKASSSEGARYLRHLLRLRLGGGARVRRAIGFAAVGTTGLLVNHLALWAVVERLGVGIGLGAVLATQASTAWNFLGNEALVFRGAEGSRSVRLAKYWALNCALLVLRVPALWLLVSTLGIGYLVANQLTFVGLFVLRFVVSDRAVWRRPASDIPDDRAYAHTYDVAGLLTIASQMELRELQAFAAPVPVGAADIEVRRGLVGSKLPTRPKVVYEDGGVTYTEHLGALFSNFEVELGETIQVTVGPLLSASPHVVYTNVVEALLRFVLVSRGYMLLHSACFELDGKGVMLSARTDTGKTGTILRLVREKGAVFLSDDMTIVHPDGTAHTYPKPLTISAHTLQAVKASPMGLRERAWLNVQSRLHSKGGRSIGAWLAERNLPIMSFNALVQAIIPPPKYMVDRLVPTVYGTSTKVEELFVIERGMPMLTALDPEAARIELLENTDDAYGFPPFAQFAPAITIHGDGYLTLRAKEEAILGRFLAGINVRRLASNSFSWADDIPSLLRAEAAIDLREPIDASGTMPAGRLASEGDTDAQLRT